MKTRLPPVVILALQLDDTSVRQSYAANGVTLTAAPQGALTAEGAPAALERIAAELLLVASSEYDMPWNVRGNCARVAKRIRQEIKEAV